MKNYKRKIKVSSIGFLYWLRMRNILVWKLARRNIIKADPY